MVFGKKEFKKSDDGKCTLSVKINGKKFEDLPLNSKLCANCNNCVYYVECKVQEYGGITKYDCTKRRDRICKVTDRIFKLLVFLITCFIYIYPMQMLFWNKVILNLGLILGLYIINMLVDNIQPKIWNSKYYQKVKQLRRIQKRNKIKLEKEKLQKEEREKKMLEKLQEEQNESGKDLTEINSRIVYARSLVIQIDKLNNIYDFKHNKENLEKCIQKLNGILFLLEGNNSYYERVKFIFELYLPEVYDALNYYKNYIEKDVVTEIREKALTTMIEKLLKYLSSQELDSILSINEIDIKFNTSIATLNKYLGGGDD